MSTGTDWIEGSPVTPEMRAASLALSRAAESVRELWGDSWAAEQLADSLYGFVDGEEDSGELNRRMTAIVDDLWDLAEEMRTTS